MKPKNLPILFVLLLAACQKEDNTPVQPSQVTTSVISPQEGQVVRKGDTLNIEANISYISKLHGYVLNIVNTANNEIVYTTSEHGHNDNFSIKEQWVDTLSAPATLKLEITTEITHDGDTSMTELMFKSQP